MRNRFKKLSARIIIAATLTVTAVPVFTQPINVQAAVSLPNLDYNTLAISTANTYVNVREKASTSSTIVGRLYGGAIATVESTSNGWAKVTSGNVKGYIHTDYLVIGSKAKENFTKYVDLVGKVTASSLRVRKSPSTSSSILTSIKNGTTHTILDEKNGWAKLTANGKTGWSSTDYLKLSYDIEYAKPVGTIGSGSTSSKVTGSQVAAYALKFKGNPYVYGGTSLTNGADCSGFVQSVYKHFGIAIPRTSSQQSLFGKKVSTSSLQQGDLIFYADHGKVNHVALYIGNGQIIHASNSKTGIIVSKYNYRSIHSARRVLS